MQTEIHTESLKNKDRRAVIFSLLHKGRCLRKIKWEKQVDTFLEMPLTKSLPTKDTLSCKALHQLYLKYNTVLPTSAAVERMFSVGKESLKNKRACYSDEHFEILVFLKD